MPRSSTRALLTAATLSLPSLAIAQEAGGFSVEPSKEPPKHQTVVTGYKASPPETQDRVFAGSRFWLLDPGRYEVELWWSNKFQPDGTSEGLLQLEVEIGLAPHLQLDLYQNFTLGTAGFGVEGNQIELRYAFGRSYNEVPLNPVLYLEWHPRKSAQDRAEVRLLLGGDWPLGLLWAANLFFEGNVDGFAGPTAQGADLEMGVTAATSLAVIQNVLRLGAEVKLGGDEHGSPTLAPMALIGPNLLLRSRPLGLKLTATAFFGLMPKDPRVYALAIGGWQF